MSKIGFDPVEIPVVFTGGNIKIGEIGGRRIAFCGGDILRNTAAIRRKFPAKAAPDTSIASVIAESFGVDEVVFIGKVWHQPHYMYHLDQAFVLLSDNTAAVTKVIREPGKNPRNKNQIEEVEKFLEEIRTVLTGYGWNIVDIDTPVANILRYEYYANAVPFINAETEEPSIFMPVFPKRGNNDADIVRVNSERFRSLGYNVIHIPTEAGKLKGGIHCLVNVIE